MNLYYAPLEGITGKIFRNAHNKSFGYVDRYYTPFIFTNPNGKISRKDVREIAPEYNPDMNLIPQLLSNNAEAFSGTCRNLKLLGFSEVNLNAGCPSATVVRKGRGSGFLKDLKAMEEFFDQVFSEADIDISVKTRIGLENEEEYERILEVYRKFPFKEVIVHPRLRTDFYKGNLHMEAFDRTMQGEMKWPVCYNGDIFTVKDLERIREQYPEIQSFMMGRGILANPALAREIKGGKAPNGEELEYFLDLLYEGYREFLDQNRKVVFLLKEQWIYIRHIFSNEDQLLVDELMHTREEEAFLGLSKKILRECRIVEGEGFKGLDAAVFDKKI